MGLVGGWWRAASLAAACVLLGVAGCANEAPPRPQVMLYVDTDLPVPELVDSILIEVLDSADEPVADSSRLVHVYRPEEGLPLSFGIVATPGATVRLRLRAFLEDRIYRLYPSPAREGHSPDTPIVVFTVDRLVEVTAPEAGVTRYQVLLAGACLGVEADVPGGLSCVPGLCDGSLCRPPPLRPVDEPECSSAHEWCSHAGEWQDALPVPCPGGPPADPAHWDEGRVCIPGGLFHLGDSHLGVTYCLSPAVGAEADICETIPERRVRLSPFYIDRYEVTVRRFREALRAGLDTSSGLYTSHSQHTLCNYQEGEDELVDQLPMNCIDQPLARAFCRSLGGSLPTEAQWEYTAAGRDQERVFSWGNDLASCESAVYGRVGPRYAGVFDGVDRVNCLSPPVGTTLECCGSGRGTCPEEDLPPGRAPVPEPDPVSLQGPQPVGSFCRDQTRDHVFDMGGNVKEWTLDLRALYGEDDLCWDRNQTLVDPLCCRDSWCEGGEAVCPMGDRNPDGSCAGVVCGPDRHCTSYYEHPIRGAGWASPSGVLPASTRWGMPPDHGALQGTCDMMGVCRGWSGYEVGFRCVYPSSP